MMEGKNGLMHLWGWPKPDLVCCVRGSWLQVG
jgi:hypothetical protein